MFVFMWINILIDNIISDIGNLRNKIYHFYYFLLSLSVSPILYTLCHSQKYKHTEQH